MNEEQMIKIFKILYKSKCLTLDEYSFIIWKLANKSTKSFIESFIKKIQNELTD